MENQSIERESDSRISTTGPIQNRLAAERIMEASVIGMTESCWLCSGLGTFSPRNA